MINASYDKKRNTVIIEFFGEIDSVQAEKFYSDIQNIIPKCAKGFKLLTDFSELQSMDIKLRDTIKKTMDLFNERGVREIVRVIPDPSKDVIGFNILGSFHYSKDVQFVTVPSRDEAMVRLGAAYDGNKKVYQGSLSPQSVENLKALLGRQVVGMYMLYAKITQESLYSIHYSLSFVDKPDYLLLESKCIETEGLDPCWQMSASYVPKPKVEYASEGYMDEVTAYSFGPELPRIQKIEIFERIAETEKTRSQYDQAIVLSSETGKKLCFSPKPNISNELEFTVNPERIAAILKGASSRLSLTF